MDKSRKFYKNDPTDKIQADINPDHCLPFIREDIELTPVFDTVFESVSVEYADSVSRDERLFDNVSGGITLKDMIVENAEGVSLSKEREYYFSIVDIVSYEIQYMKIEDITDFSEDLIAFKKACNWKYGGQ